MYGMMFDFLRQYAAKSGQAPESGGEKLYFPVTCYPDREFFEQAQALAADRGLSLSDLLADLGRFVAPRLLDYIREIAERSSSSFEVLERAEEQIAHMVRDDCPEARPPLVNSYRESADLLVMHYQSDRMLCPLARGIILGLGDAFGESLNIDESQCIQQGARDCVFRIRR